MLFPVHKLPNPIAYSVYKTLQAHPSIRGDLARLAAYVVEHGLKFIWENIEAESKVKKDSKKVKVIKLRRQCAYWNSVVVETLGQFLVPDDQPHRPQRRQFPAKIESWYDQFDNSSGVRVQDWLISTHRIEAVMMLWPGSLEPLLEEPTNPYHTTFYSYGELRFPC